MKKGVEDFVVESTPVLDLKKNPVVPLVRHEGGASDQNWDSDRTEVYADVDSDGAVATLIGQQGERYPITTFPFVMGRGSDCDLVLQGKGISRRHAEIVFQAGRFVINDFDSLNGLKINGYKVSRVILEENDLIKLGEVSLTFKSGAGESSDKAPVESVGEKKSLFFKSKSGKDKPVVQADNTFGPSVMRKAVTGVAALAAFALVGIAGFQYFNAQNAQSERAVFVPSQSQQPASVAQTTTSNVEAAPSVPAANPPAQAVVATTAQPSQSETHSAVSSVDSIAPPPSIAPPASIAKLPNPGVEKAVTVEAAKPTAVASSAKKEVARVESKSPVVAAKPQVRVDDSQKAKAARVEAERLYFAGQAESAISQLQRFVDDASLSPDVRDGIKKDFGSYNALHSQYLAGQAAYGGGNKERAFEIWAEFMDREASLFPGKRSTYSKSISARVVDEYVDLGNAASKNGEHHKAYKMWTKALELGNNVAARIAIDNANNKGMQLYRQALRLEYVNTTKAKVLWREVTEILPPGTEYHTKASAKLAWYEKWGA